MSLSQEAKNQIERPVVLSDQVTTILQKAILDGSLKEGERLIEAELQKSLSISRSPLREAFRELERRGFVEILPRRGTFVKRVTEKDITEITEVRLNLEVQAATLARRRARQGVLERMSAIMARLEKAVETQDTQVLSALHPEFHNSYIHECGNDVLRSFLEIIYFRTSWFHNSFYYYRDEDFEDWLLDHERLMAQFREPEIRRYELERAVREHINKGYKEYLARFKGVP